MPSLPIRRNTKTGDYYLGNLELAAALQGDLFLAGEPYEKALDWLIWAVTVDDPPFPEDSQGEVEVNLEPGQPTPTARLRYRWERDIGVFLHLGDILHLIDEKQRQAVGQRRESNAGRRLGRDPFDTLKER